MKFSVAATLMAVFVGTAIAAQAPPQQPASNEHICECNGKPEERRRWLVARSAACCVQQAQNFDAPEAAEEVVEVAEE